ncbi:MAG: transporter, partial [Micrococcaceae bacterium]|nr:transporter [Micrococcaceae bacterium]
ALLDDVAALARIAAASVDDVAAGAAKAGAKAAGVVIDDAAVTPQYVSGADPSRELPMIKRIFWGSLRNKLVIILPALLLISAFIPGIIPFILMLGGTYLCYEGAEKVWHKLRGHHEAETAPAVERGPEAEAKVTKGAITTDFILSCEIMVISMTEVADESLWARALILIVVAFAITVIVYGAVALIVKMDDIGLHLTTKDSAGSKRLGELLVKGMPAVLTAITFVGTIAMLWVGGHIMLQGVYDLGWHAPYDLVHVLEHPFVGIPVAGGFLAWLVNTLCSAILGLAWGLVVMAIVHPLMKALPFGKKGEHEEGDVRAAISGYRSKKQDPDPVS